MKSIRAIVFSWFFISTLTFFSAAAIVIYALSHKLINEFVVGDHQRLLGFIGANVEANLNQHLESLTALAQGRNFTKFKKASAQKELDEFLKFANLYNSIHIYAPNGDLLLATKRASVEKYTPKPNIHLQNDAKIVGLFDDVVKTQKKTISPVSRARKGLLYQVYAVPVLNEKGQLSVVVMGSFSPQISDFNFLLQGLALDDKNFISLYGEHVDLIASSSATEEKATITALSGQAAKTIRYTKGIQIVPDEKYIVLAQYLPSVDYWLVLGLNREIILSKERSVLHYLLLVYCCASIFCLVLSQLLGRRLSQPFELLIAGFKQMHLGAFHHRVDYKRNDEFGYLCELFNHMGEKLEKDKTLGDFWTNEKELEKIKNGEPL